MTPAYTISLFSERSDLGPRPTSIAASALLHVVALAVILFGIAYKPPYARVSTDHYRVRELDLNMPDEQARFYPPHIPKPASSPGARALASAGKPSLTVPALRDVAQAPPGPQTLLQPDVEKPITLPVPIPVPQVAIWSPSKVTVKKVTPPLPQKPTSADVQPSVERPNEELTLADVNVASSFHPTSHPIVNASTTSPVRVQTQQQVQLPPAMSSKSITRPTPATILSLSNLRMKEGTATLPPVNESVVVRGPGVLAAQGKDASPGKADSSAKPGQGGSSPGPGGNPNNQGSGPGQSLAFKISGPGVAPNGSRETPEPEAEKLGQIALTTLNRRRQPYPYRRTGTSTPSSSETRFRTSIRKPPACGTAEWRTPFICMLGCRGVGCCSIRFRVLLTPRKLAPRQLLKLPGPTTSCALISILDQSTPTRS